MTELRTSRTRTRTATKVMMVAPALLMFITFYLLPVIVGLGLSLFRWDGLGTPEYVGFENYRTLFGDDSFVSNIRITITVVVAGLVIVLPAALLLAVCLSGSRRVMAIFRWILFLPVVLPLAAIALLWSEIFNPIGGLANTLLGIVGIGPVPWLGQPNTALLSLIVAFVWGLIGFHVVIQLSALSAIPTELKEAARLETASGWKMYRHVVVPLLKGGLTVSGVLIASASFVFFTSLSLIMTRGGPFHATENLLLRGFLEAVTAFDFGTASAITVVTMLIATTVVGVILLIGFRNRVEY